MTLEIKKHEYGDCCYTCELYDCRNGKSYRREWEANTLEDVISLVNKLFSGEPTKRGLKEITEEE